MKFCSKCGSYMEKTIEGYSCPQCGKEIQSRITEVHKIEKTDFNTVYVADDSKIQYGEVIQECPRCKNTEAFRRISSISGDHAGVKQERIIEYYKCVKCLYKWNKS